MMKKNQSDPSSDRKRKIENYTHREKKRANNPPVGLVTPETDKDIGEKQTYAYDPHIDPSLQWAGKAERTSFEIPTVSLHVHERIDPRSIIEAVRKKNGENFVQGSLFSTTEENPPLREAVDFYKHKHNWSNRLIAGDSLLVMNSLLQKEGMAGKVQTVYIDPPYGITYGSNFQPFVDKRDVKDGSDEDLTAEPETIKAFRDTWELGVHSYLSYLRDRLLTAHELLSDSGSIFVQIGDENIHHVRELLDEVFGPENFFSLITFRTTSGLGSKGLTGIANYLLSYAKDKKQLKYRQLFSDKDFGEGTMFTYVELTDGTRRKLSKEERMNPKVIPAGARVFRLSDLVSSGLTPSCVFPYQFEGRTFEPGRNRSWKTNPDGMKRLEARRRLIAPGATLQYVTYFDDFPVSKITNVWTDTVGELDKIYAVQTSTEILKRCVLMTTDPGDLVFDPTCGSGVTAYVAEQWGRRWITCDTSRVALTLAKQRLMTAVFNYYQLAHPEEGVSSGLVYATVQHATLKSIANNQPAEQETLYDQPILDRAKVRVTGPFTVEAVPAPAVRTFSEVEDQTPPVDDSIARSGETLRQSDWRDELLKTGIRGKGGQRIQFSRVEPLPGTRWLHADAETKEEKPQRVVVSFGSEYAPLEQRQVELALSEAETLRPKPKIVVFAAFQFDPEAAKDIDETNWPSVTLLKAQMNADLLTEDLKKKRASNESFWLIGQPDIEIEKLTKGDHKGEYCVTVNGFDYYNTKTGDIESGGADKIAMWMLDTDYDGRSLFPRQVFFPMVADEEGWANLAKNLKAEVDEELLEAYRGTTSLPFEIGKHKSAAIKIIDARGIESLKVLELE
jgi:adenine-specific DNA-methyltransferase